LTLKNDDGVLSMGTTGSSDAEDADTKPKAKKLHTQQDDEVSIDYFFRQKTCASPEEQTAESSVAFSNAKFCF
jgi:hypothetical protein